MPPNASVRRPKRTCTALAAIMLSAGWAVAGCSSTSSASSAPVALPAGVTPSAPAPPTTAPPTTAPSSPASDEGVSGIWKGQYSGAYKGTFKLTWQQSGSKVTGDIVLSDPDMDAPISGNLDGDAITFGTVGSAAAVKYTGTVSGTTMSGDYTTPGGGGTWSATKS